MTYTNFPDGITSMGIPTFGAGGLLPFTGNYFFVDDSRGSDGNTGGAQDPFKTLARAYAACVAGRNDVVLLIGRQALTATQAWAKDFTHLIGLTAPTWNDRARLTSSGSSVFTPLVNVTAQGCIFANIGTFHGFADASAQICWAEAGQRNRYDHMSFGGMGNATAAAQAGGRSITVGAAGQGENEFTNCFFGLDTVARSGGNATLEFLGGSPRNAFRSCIFTMDAGSNAEFHVKCPTDGIDRWALFENCSFINTIKSGATAILSAFSVASASGGLILLQRSSIVGATDIEQTPSNNIFIDGGPPTSTTTGLAINNA